VILIGLFPNSVNGTFLTHAASSINPAFAYQEVSFWHGFNTPFIMSLIVVGAGMLLYVTRTRWQPVYKTIPGQLSVNKLYNGVVKGLDSFSEKMTKTYMTGSLRHYVSYITGTILVVTLGIMLYTHGFTVDFSALADITVIEVAVVSVIIIRAVATIYINNNLAMILMTGIVVYGVSILYVIYRAPDLALTQLVIETVSVALFLLCFYHLPKLKKRD